MRNKNYCAENTGYRESILIEKPPPHFPEVLFLKTMKNDST